jgi:hypothetical protein
MYIGILCRLRDEVRGKRSGKWQTNSWFLLHDNAPAHRLAFVMYFLTKKNVTTMEHPPYFPDLAAVDVYLFPRLNSAVMERHFFYATGIIQNAMEELKRLSQNGIHKCFQHLYSLADMYSCTSLNACTVLCFSEIK